MSGGAKTGSLQRSTHAMSFGAIETAVGAYTQDATETLQEIDQQFQIPVSGVAAPTPAYSELEVSFAVPFLDAYDERPSPYSDPNFTCGAVQKSGEPVWITCAVIEWIVEEEMFYGGAKVRVGVWGPAGSGDFVGEVHLNFQGWGSPIPDAADQGADEG